MKYYDTNIINNLIIFSRSVPATMISTHMRFPMNVYQVEGTPGKTI